MPWLLNPFSGSLDYFQPSATGGTAGPPTGPAGGGLSGTYPNPSVKPTTAMGPTPPPSPAVGQLWWRTTDGNLYIYYDDGTSQQWTPAMVGVVVPPTVVGNLAAATFFNHSIAPANTGNGATNINVAMGFAPTSNTTVSAISFYKLSTDTGVHVGTLYRESDQVVLGSVTFSGETASGWQSMALGPAVPVLAGVRYRVAVSRAGSFWAWQSSGFPGLTNPGIAAMDKNAYDGGVGNPAAYPSNVNSSGVTYLVDAILGTMPPSTYTFWTGAPPWPLTVAATGGTQSHGMDFACAVAAQAMAFLFWKDASDTGPHTGSIYRTSDQTLQGSVTFTGETASGWQRAAFPTPIPLVAGTTYRTSLSRTVSVGYVASLGAQALGPLTGGGTGYFIASATVPSFPGSTGGSANYVTDIEVAT